MSHMPVSAITLWDLLRSLAERVLDVSPAGRFSANTQSRHCADQPNLRA
jgi:hypothetical protein